MEEVKKIKTASMERYYNLKKNRICVFCGKREAIKDHVLCPICREKKIESNIGQSDRQKGRYNALKAKGICVSCGKEKSEEGKTRCQKCNEKNKIQKRKRYLKTKREAFRSIRNMEVIRCQAKIENLSESNNNVRE